MNKQITSIAITALVSIAAILFLLCFASCSTPKYGCGNGHKKQSWNRMVNRINSFN